MCVYILRVGNTKMVIAYLLYPILANESFSVKTCFLFHFEIEIKKCLNHSFVEEMNKPLTNDELPLTNVRLVLDCFILAKMSPKN